MLAAAINISFGTVMVFLFGTVAWVRRPDDRAGCWFAGWLSVLGAFIAQFAGLHAAGWKEVAAAAVELDLIALAGVFWVASAAIPVFGRRFGIRLGMVLTIPTMLCLTLAEVDIQSRWVLLSVILARQALLTAMSLMIRRPRPGFGTFMAVVCAIDAGLMTYFVFHGQTELLVQVILAEVYFAAGIDVWNKNIGQTIGMRVTSVGLLVCAAVFPLAEVVHRTWPQIATDSEMWNPPKSIIAVGMMLMMFEEQVRAAQTLGRDYRLLFDNNPHPLWIFEVESLQFCMVNEAACELHGYSKEEFLQLRLPDILHSEVRGTATTQARNPRAVPNRASRHLRKDGSEFPMDITAYGVIFQGRPCRFVLGIDVTKRDNLERRLEFELGHDSLTGLANRQLFEERLLESVDRSAKSGEKLAVLCFDIYHFKRLNEVYGPRIGDRCVDYVAKVLKASVRAMDLVARTGDDEFAILITGLRDLARAEELVVGLKESFATTARIGEFEIQLGFSLGLAVCPDDGSDAVTLWRLAENALRRAQANGGGQAIWLSPELRADAEKKLEIAGSMSRMMEEDRFYLMYQPLYAFDGSIRCLEALLRLEHPRYGPIAPLFVVRTAEETGLIEALGQWVIERACRQLKEWMDQGMRLVPVAINVSSLQLMGKGFAERLMQTLDRYSVNPRWIHLEITETAAMDNLKEVSDEMSILSALGCSFSIDDFGTGHSSLGRLHQLPISILKIDRSFIDPLGDREAAGGDTTFTIVQAILSMAHALGLEVVAEGVETETQLNCLSRLGCDLLQGFLLSRPVLPEDVPALIARPHPILEFASSREAFRPQGEALHDATIAAKG